MAEALIAEAEGRGERGIEGRAPSDEAETEPALDLLLLIECMGSHFHEHHDVVVRWPWKLFCAKWCRLLEVADERRREQEEREAKRRRDELSRALDAEMARQRAG